MDVPLIGPGPRPSITVLCAVFRVLIHLPGTIYEQRTADVTEMAFFYSISIAQAFQLITMADNVRRGKSKQSNSA